MKQFVDARLIPFALSTWLACALLTIIGTVRHPALLLCWIIVLTFAIAILVYRIRASRNAVPTWMLMVFIGTVFGSALAMTRVLPMTMGVVSQLVSSQSTIQFVGTLQADPIVKTKLEGQDWTALQQTSVAIRLEEFTFEKSVIKLRVPAMLFASNGRDEQLASGVPGMRVRGTARVATPGVGRPFALYLRAIQIVQVEPVTPRFQLLASDFRQGLHNALRHTPEQARALVPGLALGDTRAVSNTLTTDMRNAGLTHLTAVSGANVTVLLLIVLALVRKCSRSARLAVAILALAVFVVVVRPQPSVLRAAVMGIVVLIGTLRKQSADALAVLSVAIVTLIIASPLLSIDYGFALSVVATAGLIVWSPSVTNRLKAHLSPRVPNWLIQAFVVTLCAQVAVAPLLISLGSQMSLASIPANVLAVPLASVAMLAGVATALIATVSMPIAQIVAWVAAIPAWAIAQIAHVASDATWLNIPWPRGVIGVLCAIGAIVFGCAVFVSWRFCDDSQRSVVLAVVLFLVTTLWIHPDLSLRSWPPRSWTVVSCDVGQGDATIIQVARHQAVVIDVGPDPKAIDRCLRDLHIKQISLLILTHFHADHVGGLVGALHHRTVGVIRVSPLEEPSLTFSFVHSELRKRNLPFLPMTAGEQFRIAGINFQCLWPMRIIRGQGSDPNNASLVLLANIRGYTMMFAGDVESPAQKEIVQHFSLPKVDVLKIAHHGSRNQDVAFARAMSPRIGLISDGAHNMYGHPSPETVALYEALGTKLYRTDISGDLAITIRDTDSSPWQFRWFGHNSTNPEHFRQDLQVVTAR